MSNQCVISPYLPPIYIQSTSPKTPMNNVNNHILMLRSHLVIGRQTESTPENISSYVDSRAFDICICLSSTIAFNRDERVCPVYRLHMHGLPRLNLWITIIYNYIILRCTCISIYSSFTLLQKCSFEG